MTIEPLYAYRQTHKALLMRHEPIIRLSHYDMKLHRRGIPEFKRFPTFQPTKLPWRLSDGLSVI